VPRSVNLLYGRSGDWLRTPVALSPAIGALAFGESLFWRARRVELPTYWFEANAPQRIRHLTVGTTVTLSSQSLLIPKGSRHAGSGPLATLGNASMQGVGTKLATAPWGEPLHSGEVQFGPLCRQESSAQSSAPIKSRTAGPEHGAQDRGAAAAGGVKIGPDRWKSCKKGGWDGEVLRQPLKMSWFAVFVCGRKPVAAIHGLRHALGVENFKNSGIG
jgi:hypothetical protein